MAQNKSRLPVILGAMTFGENSRIPDIKECERLIEIFKSYGHSEIDTARVYNSGTSEEYLGKIGTTSRGITIATKIWPSIRDDPKNPNALSHSAADIEKTLAASLAALQLPSVDLYYLHAPDRSTPFPDTLSAITSLHSAGKFKHFGVSNFKSWEVARICELSIANNWTLPTVYQGVYNVIHREIEPELISCLRHYKISFYAYNPLAGGFFTASGPKSIEGEVPEGTRFDASGRQGQLYRARYWKKGYFDARAYIEPVAEKHGLTLVEVALRWMNHHSQLSPEFGDRVIIGASSEKHLRENLEDLEKGPLPEEVVEACDVAWSLVKAEAETYWR
ncbi:hypothetical protein ABW19_dt0204681 [Dactylella cylindrospora]|nr:hypothetical protein ABW19_dt0204681 [Dactylella cylindrospora]